MNRFLFFTLFLFLINCNKPVELIVDDPMYEGEFIDSILDTKNHNFTFSAAPNSIYAIVWDDSGEGSGTKTADVNVTVSSSISIVQENYCIGNIVSSEACYDNQNNTYEIIDQWSRVPMTKMNHGYTTFRILANGSTAQEFSIDVNCDFCRTGTYGIQVVSMSAPLAVGGGISEGYLAARTPSVHSKIFAYQVAVSPLTNYTLKIDDTGDGSSTYSQDVWAFITHSDPVSIDLLENSIDNSFTTPFVFNSALHTNLFIWVSLTTTSPTAQGYSIRVD